MARHITGLALFEVLHFHRAALGERAAVQGELQGTPAVRNLNLTGDSCNYCYALRRKITAARKAKGARETPESASVMKV